MFEELREKVVEKQKRVWVLERLLREARDVSLAAAEVDKGFKTHIPYSGPLSYLLRRPVELEVSVGGEIQAAMLSEIDSRRSALLARLSRAIETFDSEEFSEPERAAELQSEFEEVAIDG